MVFAPIAGMTRFTSILLTATATGLATWWFRSRKQVQRPVRVEQGDIIYRNAPLAGAGE
jgi:hypothetical protein